MARYPASVVEEVRAASDIVSVVGEYVRLQKRGREFVGLCPFHKEKTPSFTVVPSEQFFYCFGCKKGGSVFRFIMEAENLDFVDSLAKLAEKSGITLPEPDEPADLEKAWVRSQIIKMNADAARFYYRCLQDGIGSKARDYLAKRGISRSIAVRFGLGYSPDDWSSLFEHLKSKGYDQELIVKSGLVNRSEKGFYDRFRDRLVFPIFDIRDNIVGFGGRILGDGQPKYINSSDTPVYLKGKNLYALNFAKNIIKEMEEKSIIVVEGYMDVISLSQAGIRNVVASLGTALTESQGRLLSRYADTIVISYDSDSAGREAALKGIELLDSMGASVKVLELPAGKDPDEFIKRYGPDGFRKAITGALSFVDYKIKNLKRKLDIHKIDQKIKFMNETANILAKISNNVEREIYIRKTALDNDISEESLAAEVAKKVRRMYAAGSYADNRQGDKTLYGASAKSGVDSTFNSESTGGMQSILHGNSVDPVPELERMLLVLLCKENSILENIINAYGEESFSDSNKAAFMYALNRIKSGTSLMAIDLLTQFDENEQNLFTKHLVTTAGYTDIIKAADDIIAKIIKFKADKRIDELVKLLESDVNGEKAEEYGNELKKLLRERKC